MGILRIETVPTDLYEVEIWSAANHYKLLPRLSLHYADAYNRDKIRTYYKIDGGNSCPLYDARRIENPELKLLFTLLPLILRWHAYFIAR